MKQVLEARLENVRQDLDIYRRALVTGRLGKDGLPRLRELMQAEATLLIQIYARLLPGEVLVYNASGRGFEETKLMPKYRELDNKALQNIALATWDKTEQCFRTLDGKENFLLDPQRVRVALEVYAQRFLPVEAS